MISFNRTAVIRFQARLFRLEFGCGSGDGSESSETLIKKIFVLKIFCNWCDVNEGRWRVVDVMKLLSWRKFEFSVIDFLSNSIFLLLILFLVC